MEDTLNLDACRVAPSIRSGRLQSTAYIEGVLERYEQNCKYDNVFTSSFSIDNVKKQFSVPEKPTDGGVLSPRKAVSGPIPKGALAGVPFVVSSNFDVPSYSTSAGSELLQISLPQSEAPVITALKHAGAAVLGQTNMGELGLGVTGSNATYGTVRNVSN